MTWTETILTIAALLVVSAAGGWPWWLTFAISFATSVVVTGVRAYVDVAEQEEPDR